MRCGIGSYAFQMARKLQVLGHIVNIFSPIEGDGDFSENFKGDFNLLHIMKYGFFYDKIVFQFHQSFFYDDFTKNKSSIIKTNLSFIFIFIVFRNKVEVIIHETPNPPETFLHKWLDKLKWIFCKKLIFHTEKEKNLFESTYLKLPSNKYELWDPGKYYFKFRDISLNNARSELNLPSDKLIFLCIGFIQPHKGYDIAINAFCKKRAEMELYIVGSLRVISDEYIEYLRKLKGMSKDNNIHVIEKYLSDEEFDTWIIASDVVVVPYREVWSSAVLARAKLFGKLVIAADAGGLSEQINERDIIYKNEDELKSIFMSFGYNGYKGKQSIEREL
jgi:glycosyltransferase involved in cell wall biosynthesis